MHSPLTRKPIAFVCLALFMLTLWSPLAGRADTRGTASYDLEIDMVADPDPATAGGQVTVTITATNLGPSSVPGLSMKTMTPDGTTFDSLSAPDGSESSTPDPDGTGEIVCFISQQLFTDESVSIDVVFNVTAEPGETLVFDGSLDGGDTGGVDTDPSNNDTSIAVAVGTESVADLAVEIDPESDEAASGSLFTFYVDVSNLSEIDGGADAEGVYVVIDVPKGTTFADIYSAGECDTPDVGDGGTIVCTFDTLAPGESEEIEVTVDVDAAPDETLALAASVDSSSEDPDFENNDDLVFVDVVPSEDAMLDWDEPDFDSGATLPPPRNLVVDDSAPAVHEVPKAASPRGTIIGYNVYRSTMPGVVPTAGSLLTSVPPSQTNAMVPAAPSGTFFVVTAVYDDGESMPSNEASAEVPAATLGKVKVKAAKITANGDGFSDEVQVFVDGIPFVSPATVKKQGKKVIQKGTLITGQTIGAYLTGKTDALVTFRNSNGGVAAYRYHR